MSYILKSCSLFLTLLLTSCSSILVDTRLPNDSVYFKDGFVFYNGKIDDNKNVIAFNLFNERKVKGFKISSPGGDVESAINLAYRIRKENIIVYVGKLCASSCANYILTAARKTFIESESAIIWHGSSFQEDVSRFVLEKDERYMHWRNLETRFYNEIGVSPLITVCGIDQVGASEQIFHYLSIKKISGFTYSLNDIEKFGVKTIFLKNGKWDKQDEYNGMRIIQAEYCSNVSWKY